MSVNSKQKGKRGELELVHAFRQYGYDTHRSVQYNGKAEDGEADLVGLEDIHVECKYTNALRLYDAVKQSIRDTKTTGKKELPVVFHRKSREDWVAIMPLDVFFTLYNGYEKNKKGEEKNNETEN